MQPSPLVGRLSRTARVLASAAALVCACAAVYWTRQIALGAPDAYHGQARGGLLLALAVVVQSTGTLVPKPRLQIACVVVSFLLLAGALYVLGYLGL